MLRQEETRHNLRVCPEVLGSLSFKEDEKFRLILKQVRILLNRRGLRTLSFSNNKSTIFQTGLRIENFFVDFTQMSLNPIVEVH